MSVGVANGGEVDNLKAEKRCSEDSSEGEESKDVGKQRAEEKPQEKHEHHCGICGSSGHKRQTCDSAFKIPSDKKRCCYELHSTLFPKTPKIMPKSSFNTMRNDCKSCQSHQSKERRRRKRK